LPYLSLRQRPDSMSSYVYHFHHNGNVCCARWLPTHPYEIVGMPSVPAHGKVDRMFGSTIRLRGRLLSSDPLHQSRLSAHNQVVKVIRGLGFRLLTALRRFQRSVSFGEVRSSNFSSLTKFQKYTSGLYVCQEAILFFVIQHILFSFKKCFRN
jgi:hypothetical protein